ncbi:MAG: hypothetical protein HY207_01560 [Nitrospirae bacterium]|nr:hypothetical protein [Nitrospirota bacterium]
MKSAIGILACIVAAGLSACGIETSAKAPEKPVPPPPIALAGAVNKVADANGNARYLGEIKNNGTVVACSINLSINSYDAAGNLLNDPSNSQFSFGDLLGETFRFSAFAPQAQDNCLSPGRTGSFDIPTKVRLGDVVSFVVDVPCGKQQFYSGCLASDQPFVPPPATLVLDGAVTEGVTGDGRVVYTGAIRNQSEAESAVAYHVKIVMTVKNADGLVVDVACATIDGSVCPVPADANLANTSGLRPQDTWNFTVPLSITPAETCSGCFSFVINQKLAL